MKKLKKINSNQKSLMKIINIRIFKVVLLNLNMLSKKMI